jgi:hypothetical protein
MPRLCNSGASSKERSKEKLNNDRKNKELKTEETRKREGNN